MPRKNQAHTGFQVKLNVARKSSKESWSKSPIYFSQIFIVGGIIMFRCETNFKLPCLESFTTEKCTVLIKDI